MTGNGKCGCGRRTAEAVCSTCSREVFWEYKNLLPVDVYVEEGLGWLDAAEAETDDG